MQRLPHGIIRNGDKMKRIKMFIIGLLLLTGCSSTPTLEKYSDTILDVGFDTFVSLIAYCEDEETYAGYQSLLRDEFIRYNQLFDRYHTYEGINNVKTINDQAGIAPVKVDQEVIDLFQLTKTYGEISEQQYNTTFGAVLEIWHNYRNEAENGNPALPTKDELNNALQHTGWDKVEIDEAAQTVYINDPATSIDLGSAAKGYATEMVAKKLEEAGLRHAIVNAGGNVRIIGEKIGADYWSVGLQIPVLNENSAIADVYIKSNMSFVTSGDYQRYYEVDGKKYHHIIDPHTLYPATHARSITIVTPDSTIADILSTTFFTLSYEEGNALLKKLHEQGIDVNAIWVFDDTTEIPDNVELQTSGSYKIAISDGLKEQVQVK